MAQFALSSGTKTLKCNNTEAATAGSSLDHTGLSSSNDEQRLLKLGQRVWIYFMTLVPGLAPRYLQCGFPASQTSFQTAAGY